MSGLKVGMILLTLEDPQSGVAPTWEQLRDRAVLAERFGYDTVWISDELQWETEEWDGPRGWWECVSVAGAIAASTSTIHVGTWVLSALHRNPGLTVRVTETLDEISGGRFIFGLGTGHAGRQGEAFGFPPNYTVSRYEEALSIITALRDSGRSTFDGKFHQTKDQILSPRSTSGRHIPLMLGAHGERTMKLAVDNADIWSAYATTSSQPEAFTEMIEQLNGVCASANRDTGTLGKSIGIFVAPPGQKPPQWLEGEDVIQGPVDEIIETFRRFHEMGCTRLEVMVAGDAGETIEGLAPVVEAAGSF